MTQTHYCGYKLSEYAIRTYGLPFIQSAVAQVEYCAHGPLCERCCFLYKGKTWTNRVTYAKKSKVGSLVFLHCKGSVKRLNPSLGTFFWHLVFGKVSNRWVQRLCSERLCVNLMHKRSNPCRFIIDDLVDFIEFCEHGRLCERCCWPWCGRFVRCGTSKVPAFYSNGTHNNAYVVAYLARDIGLSIPKGWRVYRDCQLMECCSFWHTYSMSTSDRGRALIKGLLPRKTFYANNRIEAVSN